MVCPDLAETPLIMQLLLFYLQAARLMAAAEALVRTDQAPEAQPQQTQAAAAAVELELLAAMAVQESLLFIG
jgi:hypothetical protein